MRMDGLIVCVCVLFFSFFCFLFAIEKRWRFQELQRRQRHAPTSCGMRRSKSSTSIHCAWLGNWLTNKLRKLVHATQLRLWRSDYGAEMSLNCTPRKQQVYPALKIIIIKVKIWSCTKKLRKIKEINKKIKNDIMKIMK